MASYHYDESGNMALYFIITFLVIILIPFSISALSSVTKRMYIPATYTLLYSKAFVMNNIADECLGLGAMLPRIQVVPYLLHHASVALVLNSASG